MVVVSIQEYLEKNYPDKETVERIIIDDKFRSEVEGEVIISDYPRLVEIKYTPSNCLKTKFTNVRIGDCPALLRVEVRHFGSGFQQFEIRNCPALISLKTFIGVR